MELLALKEPMTGGIPYRVWMERDLAALCDIMGTEDMVIAFEVSIVN
jgi:hypothetical protein